MLAKFTAVGLWGPNKGPNTAQISSTPSTIEGSKGARRRPAITFSALCQHNCGPLNTTV